MERKLIPILGKHGKEECQKDGYSHSWVGMSYTLNWLFPLDDHPGIEGGVEGKRLGAVQGSLVDAQGYTSSGVNPTAEMEHRKR